MDAILEVKNLSKIYNKKDNRGIQNLNFSVPRGSFHAFVGENGAGKTTTIKSIINSFSNWTGQILIDNKDNKTAESKEKIGYVPENALFPKEIKTIDYLLSFALLSGMDKAKAKEKIKDMLTRLDIIDLINKKPYSFSSGQKKKVLLIQALIHEPDLIILDEPAANLDPSARYELFKILEDLKNQGKTIFISSHILSEIDKYIDSLTLIHDGQIVFNGEKNQNLEEIYHEKIIKTN